MGGIGLPAVDVGGRRAVDVGGRLAVDVGGRLAKDGGGRRGNRLAADGAGAPAALLPQAEAVGAEAVLAREGRPARVGRKWVADGHGLKADDARVVVAQVIGLIGLGGLRGRNQGTLLLHELAAGRRKQLALRLCRLGDHVLGRLVEPLGHLPGHRLGALGGDRRLEGSIQLLEDRLVHLLAQVGDRGVERHGDIPVTRGLLLARGCREQHLERGLHVAVDLAHLEGCVGQHGGVVNGAEHYGRLRLQSVLDTFVFPR